MTHINGLRVASYDPNGNMTTRAESATYAQTFDIENRLTAVNGVRFGYDADGGMVKKVEGSKTTTYVGNYFEKEQAAVFVPSTQKSFGANWRMENFALPGGKTRKYYFFGGQRVAVRENNVAPQWIHGDHLGSASITTDNAGAKVGEMRYTPFGSMRVDTGDVKGNKRFQDSERVASIELDAMGARFYSAGFGRFISADSIVPGAGNPQSFNRYSFVLNNPLKLVDPTGHFSDDELVKYGVYKSHTEIKKLAGETNLRMYYLLRAASLGDRWSDSVRLTYGFIEGGNLKLNGNLILKDGKLTIQTSADDFNITASSYRGIGTGSHGMAFSPSLSSKEGLVLGDLESARKHVQTNLYGSHDALSLDFHEIALGGYIGVGGHLALRRDRYDRWFLSLNIGLGFGGRAIAITQGTIEQSYIPDQGQLDSVNKGFGMAFSGGFHAGGAIGVADGPIPFQYGYVSPGAAFSFGHGWQIK